MMLGLTSCDLASYYKPCHCLEDDPRAEDYVWPEVAGSFGADKAQPLSGLR
jgi:hypothetical protein